METIKSSRIATVKWNDIIIGYLIQDREGYVFKYDCDGITSARKQGYTYLIGFKNLRQVYQSEQLFPVFKSRIPSRQRRNIDQILQELGLEEYNEFDILLAKKGKTNTDSITIEEDVDKVRLQNLHARNKERRKVSGRRNYRLMDREEKVNEK